MTPQNATVSAKPGAPAAPNAPKFDLAKRAIPLKVEFHTFGNSRKISTHYVDILDGMSGKVDGDLKKSRISASKRLLESPELAAVKTFDGHVNKHVKGICLPFEFGIDLVPYVAVPALDQKLAEFVIERQQLVDKFCEAYPARCQEAATDLNSQYKPGDYPPVEEVKRRFGFSWKYIPLGVPDELKAISKQVWEQERAKAADRMAEAAVEIQQVLREAMLELVKHMSERLQEKEGKPVMVFKSTLTNLTDFLGTFDFRNITDDAELQGIVTQARNLLGGATIEHLRTPGAARDNVKATMAEIAVQLDGLVVKNRKFRFED